MRVKYAKDIIKEIQARGSIQVPEGYITGEAFEEWLEGKENFGMSISEQVKELKKLVKEYKNSPYGREVAGTTEALSKAADTIEALYEKLQTANMERSEVYYNGKKQRSLTINIQIGKDETNSDIMQLLSEIIDETNDKGYAVMNAIVDGMEVFDYKGFSKDFFNPKE